MTFGDLLAALWRRRVLAALGLLLTTVAVFLGSGPVAAWNGRVSVVFIVPEGSPGNALAPTTSSMIAVAGVVSRVVNGLNEKPQTVSADLTLSSLGVDHGWSARQPNIGGQWDVNYQEPRLDVKSVGSTPEEAAGQMSNALSEIERSLIRLQDQQGVAKDNRIRIELSPANPAYTIQSGSRVRVMGATGLAGLVATLAAVLSAERFGRDQIGRVSVNRSEPR